ncbi:hypothetical protein L0128_11865, partial [candidate division KSB1 bacterium]|nr:hypothetical protein [candidate division KSB1 bacterium]
WQPELDLRADVAIVYGVSPTFAERIQSWREQGYQVHLMTGSAWGEYQDYFEGRFDGRTHYDEGQMQRDGETIWHGKNVPYVVPTQSYLNYLKSLIKIAIDAGVTTIHLEEPEFWNRAGYSEGFKREWQAYYGQPWQAQHESPAATYQSNKLKHHLYIRALTELFDYAKEYGAQKGQTSRGFVPTHSLLNYASWHIVSPEAALAQISGLDGFIGQVWTGTARHPNYYDGILKERTFETAFLEYGSVLAMTRPTGKSVYFLTDPIEDNPDKTWEDYKTNYEATFVAQLMYPQVSHYEVMPWPGRIFLGKYQIQGSAERQPISPEYATEILVLINTLHQMAQSHLKFPGTKGIAVLQSNTMMFQSFPEHAGYTDPWLSNFYGMALPLLKHGIPVEIVQLEHLHYPAALEGIKTLMLSYASMKPLQPEYHQILTAWVKQGGTLIYCGRDDDPYQQAPEWWNQGATKYATPAEHLFECLGINRTHSELIHPLGKGWVATISKNPKEFILAPGAAEELRDVVAQMFQRLKRETDWQEKNVLHLERGPFEIIAVLDESMSSEPYHLAGVFINLFDPELPILHWQTVRPGQRSLLYNVQRYPGAAPAVLAAASRVSEEQLTPGEYTCTLKGPAGTQGIARLWFPHQPRQVIISTGMNQPVSDEYDWDQVSKTVLIRYPNQPAGVRAEVKY